jgi:hypothetical protein
MQPVDPLAEETPKPEREPERRPEPESCQGIVFS